MKVSKFPQEIKELILKRQEEQGNPRDISVFDNNYMRGEENKGFTWSKTPEKHNFWYKIIVDKNFKEFYKKYPKKQMTLEILVNLI